MFSDIKEKEKIMKKLILTMALLISLSFSAPVFADHSDGTVYASVNGLVCDFCARALEKVFGKQEAVESINVDLDKKIITIHFNEGENLNDNVITQLITDAGYNVRGIRHGE